jgi:hypothetical protein
MNLTKAIRIVKNDGISELIKRGVPYAYTNYIAPVLPRTNASYNGVDVEAARYFDGVIPWRQKDRPYYESGLISGIEEYVREGDNVVIVGGGWGVTAVKAAEKVEGSGSVTVYEGSDKEINHVQQTITEYNLSDRVDITHGIVGEKINLRGEAKGAARVSPEQLPECDVLELDCEGAEIEILENMKIRPRVILVETHGLFDSPSSEVEDILDNLSYSIESKVIAEKDNEQMHKEQDVYCIAAARV